MVIEACRDSYANVIFGNELEQKSKQNFYLSIYTTIRLFYIICFNIANKRALRYFYGYYVIVFSSPR